MRKIYGTYSATPYDRRCTPAQFAWLANEGDRAKITNLRDEPLTWYLEARCRSNLSAATLVFEAVTGEPEIVFPGSPRVATPWELTALHGDMTQLRTLSSCLIYLACTHPSGQSPAGPWVDMMLRGGELLVVDGGKHAEPTRVINFGNLSGMLIEEQTGESHQIWGSK